ncbi:hypothetical protein BTH71_06455 [Lactobacillus delbrueckii subsp. bulgaricus]|nr:hypothetical protein [Lactobacillus delbrueckii subsp. bulgaricus]
MVTTSQQTLLLPEIDDQETAARVRAFFDRDIPRLLNRAGRPISDLTSPKLDATGGGGSGYGNGQERKLIDRLEAVEVYNAVVDAVIETVSLMRDDEAYYYHRTLLVDCYIKRVREKVEMIKLGMTETPIRLHKRAACVEFAELFDSVKYKKGLDEELLPSMVVYKFSESV